MATTKTMTVSGSPVTNTGTGTATLAVVSGKPHVSILATFTKTSGTLGGTATLQGSIDGTTYETIPTGATLGGASTYTVTDTASQKASFTVKNNAYNYYRISWTGTGTMVGTMSAILLTK
jgi:hypothetical protein